MMNIQPGLFTSWKLHLGILSWLLWWSTQPFLHAHTHARTHAHTHAWCIHANMHSLFMVVHISDTEKISYLQSQSYSARVTHAHRISFSLCARGWMSTAYYWKSGNENRCKQAEKERERERVMEGDGKEKNSRRRGSGKEKRDRSEE